eukprot:3416263-Pleurochrysis_carterae.AAC.1
MSFRQIILYLIQSLEACTALTRSTLVAPLTAVAVHRTGVSHTGWYTGQGAIRPKPEAGEGAARAGRPALSLQEAPGEERRLPGALQSQVLRREADGRRDRGAQGGEPAA